ncbi:MAG: universal stress protein [Chloroflexota bacterium]|nr:universal stress protein [Chloroflexota bacterium]
MFTRILAAVDDSTRATQVMEAASALAERTGSSLIALRVRSPTRADASPTARDLDLAEETRILREHGLAAHYLLHDGSPERQIIETAELQHATLIVMASRRAGPRILPGRRMTARLASAAPAPVLTLPEVDPNDAQPAPFMAEGAAIVVALDGSALAERALPYAVDLARLLHGPLALAHVAEPILSPAEEAAAWTYVRAARRRLRTAAPDLTVDAQVVTGAPVDQLLYAAEGRRAAAIVLAARGKSGSSSQRVSHIALEALNRARIPMLVIPARALAGAREYPQSSDEIEAPVP